MAVMYVHKLSVEFGIFRAARANGTHVAQRRVDDLSPFIARTGLVMIRRKIERS